MPNLILALRVAKGSKDSAQKNGLVEAVKLKRAAAKLRTPISGAISSTNTNKSDSMTFSMSSVSTSTEEPALLDEFSVGSHLTAEGAATAPVPRTISTGESTQEVRLMSMKVAKAQKEAEITLEMLKATITRQEDEASGRGIEAEKALQEAKNQLAARNKRFAIRYMKEFKRCLLEQEKIISDIETLDQQVSTIKSVLSNAKCVEENLASILALSYLQGTDGRALVEVVMNDLKVSHHIVAIKEIVSRVVTATPFDEEDLLRELEELSGS